MTNHCYSPLPSERYRLEGMPQDEITTLREHGREDAIWNMFWLSVPSLDNIPGAGKNWTKVYTPVPGALGSIISDVSGDEPLYRKVLMHPYAFMSFFERQDHSIFDTYAQLGGQRWVDTVMERAELAGARLTLRNPAVTVDGNVLKVDFRRAA